MFKTKKIQADAKGAASKGAKAPAARAKAAPVKRAASKAAAKPSPKIVSSTPGSRSVKRLINKASAKPGVVKSSKGSPLRKRVVAPLGKAKAPAPRAGAGANLLRDDEPAMQAAQAAIDK